MAGSKVLGISGLRKGEYQGREYSNHRLYLDNEIIPEGGKGTTLEVVTIPGKVDISAIEVGDYVRVMYNRFGRVDAVELV